MSAHIVSVQIGKVQTHILDDGSEWTTAYFKHPVDTPLFLHETALEGDEQKHKKFHGGEHRSLLAYNAEHYTKWHEELGKELPYGAFGENLVITELNEDNVCIGDIYAIGDEVRVQVSQPRVPCNQIDRCWGIPYLNREVMKHMRTGWYMRTLQTGLVGAGMKVELLERPEPRWTVRAAHNAKQFLASQPENALALSQVPALEPGWRKRIADALS
jgi:MOSC domain-containing protein YiiM